MKQQISLEEAKLYENWDLLAKQTVEGFITGLHRSPYHGFSVEFAEHKIYNSGEGTKHIDWKVYAKTDKLYTKQYEEETNLRCTILLDNSYSMFYPSKSYEKYFFATWLSAAISHLLVRQRDAVGLKIFSNEISYSSAIKSNKNHLHQLLITLKNSISEIPKHEISTTNISQTIHLLAEQIHSRSLVVIFSDMFDSKNNTEDIINALQHLRHRGHEVLLFHVYDPKTELKLEFENRPILFSDLETGEKIKLNPTLYKEAYEKVNQDFFNELAQKCGGLKITFIPCPCDSSPNEVLLQFLIKRNGMK